MARKPAPLSAAALTILQRMLEGWTLHESTSYMSTGKWLSRTGEHRGVNASSVHALCNRDLLHCVKNDFPTRELVMTDAGRALAKQTFDPPALTVQS